ncbi:GD24007 [Drosophila simulans]|uniref:GD24007 n=1 Tax=Drosophila simulans TaxID=7240 RepID=B4Q6E9_DROSI|nr:GD24007 [Drosophila simulans]
MLQTVRQSRACSDVPSPIPPNVNDFETDDGALAKISSGQDKDHTVDLAKKN